MKELIRILNLPRNTVEIVKTSDGFYLGRAAGDIGCNQFFGRPSHHAGPGRNASVQTWKGYTFGERREALRAARAVGVQLRDFLPKSLLSV